MTIMMRASSDGTLITLYSLSIETWMFDISGNPPFKSIWDYEDEAAWMNDMVYFHEEVA